MNFLLLEWVMRAVGGYTDVGRKVELTQREWMNKIYECIDSAFHVPPD
jgi:hypothetical protein